MTNVKEFHCHMRMNLLQPYEENQICLALFHGTGDNVQVGPSEHRDRPVHKMDFTDIIDLFTAAKTRKDCFNCFVLRTCNFGFRFHLFLYQKILLQSVQFEKYSFSNFYDFCVFKSHIRIQSQGFK